MTQETKKKGPEEDNWERKGLEERGECYIKETKSRRKRILKKREMISKKIKKMDTGKKQN